MSFNANRLISVGRILAIANIIGAVLVSMSILWVTNVASHLASLQDRHKIDYALGEQLHQSSDDLTRLARTYAVTGDPQFETQYFQLLAIRNGEAPRPENYGEVYWDFVSAGLIEVATEGPKVSMDELLLAADFTATEYALLTESHAASDSLVSLETQAMNAIKGLYQDSAGEYTVHGAPNLPLARTLLHSPEYHLFKAEIMTPMNTFMRTLDSRFAAEIGAVAKKQSLSLTLLILIAVVTILITIANYLLMQNVVLSPLTAMGKVFGRLDDWDLPRDDIANKRAA
ncbi:hypothetical protein [Halocynthiibacter namhaensis]|uniref:hypothetical protein n=1 Tax=Halocynthiibacter namhaensis TaxID=1290553 RepID=UPI0006903912|nr:hypothetical protein [Halocynthiibacter namhaensis]